MSAPTRITVRDAAEKWLEGARAGVVLTRSGDRYKPSVLRSYEGASRLRVLPEIGGGKLSEIRRRDVQTLVDDWQAAGHSTIRNSVMPLCVICKRRTVPIASVLREQLVSHKLRSGTHDGLVCCSSRGTVFDPPTITERARKAWGWAKDAEGAWVATGPESLEPITLHECRHTFASLMIAAGVNAKALSTFMGHGSISIALDRYGHLMPGSEAAAAGLLDAYLTGAVVAPAVAPVAPVV